MTKVKDFLKNIGLKSKDIEALLDEENQDFDPKEKATEFKTELKADIREAVKNDKEIRDEITREVEGRYAGTWRSVLKKAGLSTEETAEGKTPSEMVKTLTDKLSEGKGKELKELEAELLEERNEKRRLLEEEIPKIKTEAKREADSVHVNSKLETFYKSIDKGRLVGDEHNPAFLEVALFKLSNKYDWRWENNEPVPYQKGSDRFATLEGGTKVAKAQELLEYELEENNFIKKSNGKGTPQQPAGRPVTDPVPASGKVIPGLAEAQANLKRLEGVQ